MILNGEVVGIESLVSRKGKPFRIGRIGTFGMNLIRVFLPDEVVVNVGDKVPLEIHLSADSQGNLVAKAELKK